MVTTLQLVAAEVAERVYAIAVQTRQRRPHVVENMVDSPTLKIPARAAAVRSPRAWPSHDGRRRTALGQVPLDPALVAAGDTGCWRCPRPTRGAYGVAEQDRRRAGGEEARAGGFKMSLA